MEGKTIMSFFSRIIQGNNKIGSSEVKCPYCLKTVKKYDFEYICDTCGNKQPTYIIPHGCNVNGCNGKLFLKHSGCDDLIPMDFLQYKKYLNFCVVGPSNCGKTNYITVMLEEFKKKLGDRFFLSYMNDYTKNTQKENRKLLYSEKIVIPNTQRGKLPPQLWAISDQKESYKGIKQFPVYNMTIFDGAGEDYNDMDPAVRNYIGGSDYLFFLIDPTQLKSFNGELYGEDYGYDLVIGMSNYIRSIMGLEPGTRIEKKVAIILTKFDEVEDAFSGSQILQDNRFISDSQRLSDEFDQINLEIKTGLKRMDEQALLNALNVNFMYTRFFGVSSYGHAPDASDNVGIITPHRVLDPVLWVLNEEGIL